MNRYLWMVFGLVLLAPAGATTAGDDKAAGGLTVEQLLQRNLDARGGLKAWRAAQTMTISGRLEAGGTKNTALPFVLEMKRPRMSRLEITFRDQKAIQVYDGEHGWKVRPFLGRNDVEPFTPAEIKAASGWQELDGALIDHVRKGTRVALQGMGSVEGHKTYKLLLTLKNGEKRHLWLDAKTYLERRIDGQRRKLDGKLRNVYVYYRDYRTEHGLTMAHMLETRVDGGKIPHKMYIDSVAVNKPLGDGMFAKPVLAMSVPAR